MNNLREECIRDQYSQYVIPEYKTKFIEKYKDQYIPDILTHYIKYYTIIHDIMTLLKEANNPKDRFDKFMSLRNFHKGIFLNNYNIHKFNKHNNSVKQIILLYYFNLYKEHENIVNEFFDICVEKKRTITEENERIVNIVSPEASPSNRQKSRIEAMLSNYPKKYDSQSSQIPRNINQIDPNLKSRLSTIMEDLGYGGNKYKRIYCSRRRNKKRKRTCKKK